MDTRQMTGWGSEISGMEWRGWMKRETERDALYDKQKGKLREKALRRIQAVTHIYSLIQSVRLLESQLTHVNRCSQVCTHTVTGRWEASLVSLECEMTSQKTGFFGFRYLSSFRPALLTSPERKREWKHSWILVDQNVVFDKMCILYAVIVSNMSQNRNIL